MNLLKFSTCQIFQFPLILISLISLCHGSKLDDLEREEDVMISTTTVPEKETILPEIAPTKSTIPYWSSWYRTYKPSYLNPKPEESDSTLDNSFNNKDINNLDFDTLFNKYKLNYSYIYPNDNNFKYNDDIGLNNYNYKSYDSTPTYTSSTRVTYYPIGFVVFFIVVICKFGIRLCAQDSGVPVSRRTAGSTTSPSHLYNRQPTLVTATTVNGGTIPVFITASSSRTILIPLGDDNREGDTSPNNDVADGTETTSGDNSKPPAYWETFLDDDDDKPPPSYDDAAKKETLVQIV